MILAAISSYPSRLAINIPESSSYNSIDTGHCALHRTVFLVTQHTITYRNYDKSLTSGMCKMAIGPSLAFLRCA